MSVSLRPAPQRLGPRSRGGGWGAAAAASSCSWVEAAAVEVFLQATSRRPQNVSVSSPADGDHTIPWWWDPLAQQARAFRLAGFIAVLLPHVLKTSAGAHHGADGYGPFDDYDYRTIAEGPAASVGRVWCAEGSALEATLSALANDRTADTEVQSRSSIPEARAFPRSGGRPRSRPPGRRAPR